MTHVLALTGDANLLAMVDTGGRVHRAPVTALARELSPEESGGVPAFLLPLSWTNLVQLMATLPGAVLTPQLEEWAVAEAGSRAANLDLDTQTPELFAPNGDPMSLPEGKNPFPWQSAAAHRFARVGSAMLSDEPGTGKTLSALLAIAARTDTLPALVVAPASVVSSWVQMAQEWFPAWQVTAYRGPRRKLAGDIVVTGYEILTRDVDKLTAYGFRTLVLDEHHLLKNRAAKRTEAAQTLSQNVDKCIAMSGTPITHSPDDIFPVLRILDPESWPARDRWMQRYLDVVDGDYRPEIIGFRADRRGEFDLCLAGVWRQVTKEEALPNLPPKLYSTREVEMPAKWRKVYKDMAETMSADLPDGEGEIDVMTVLTMLTVLTALTAGPCKVEFNPNENPEKPDHVHTILQPGSWKVAELMDILEERPGASVLVFAPSRQLIDQATHAVRDVLGADAAVQIVGGQTVSERDAAKDAFQSGRAKVCLATVQAGGVGLTLTAAQTVVFLGRPFSLVDTLQSEDRPHRPGIEHESLEIIDVVTRNSVDQRVQRVLRERGLSLEDFLTGAESVRKLIRG